MTLSRNEFIAETAAKHDVVLDGKSDYRNGCKQAVELAVNLANALEAAKCAPWRSDADAGSFQAVKPFVDAAVKQERERCAKIADSYDFGEPLAAKISAAIRAGAAP